MAVLRAMGGIVFLALLTLLLLPLHLPALLVAPKLASWIAYAWQFAARRILGVRTILHGRPADGPVLYLANHVSWLDIVVLSRAAPLSFIAKADVARWPVFSWLAKWQRTIFVERDKRSRTGLVVSDMVARLEAGERLVLFPEGTNSDGWHVLPFKSALIGAVVEAARNMDDDGVMLEVQPVALAYTHLGGLPLGRLEDNKVAWLGDVDLIPHLWEVLAGPILETHLYFGDPVRVDATTNRKHLTRDMENEVNALLCAIRH